jgi:hypothetical protein
MTVILLHGLGLFLSSGNFVLWSLIIHNLSIYIFTLLHLYMGPNIFWKSSSHTILGTGRVTRSNFYKKDPQLRSDLWISLLPGMCWIHANALSYMYTKNCRNYADSIRWHGTKFSESGTFSLCILAVTTFLQFICTPVCGTCWNTILGTVGTRAEIQHVLLPSRGLPIITHCRALWTFVFILIAQ